MLSVKPKTTQKFLNFMRIAEGHENYFLLEGKVQGTARISLSVQWDHHKQHNSIHHYNDSHERQLHNFFSATSRRHWQQKN